ncbi:hypothetical protein [uncultured Brevundimonas sp.]|uniref:hypothetical protein n=1 Tax=uncultured Brevundimonas sp. TaxID=213418 RepID=UPI0030ED6674|tara:strand:- start:1367 stop:2380 length:1014 start_codon:yes stop_codon:yes gene_type:complete
MLAFVVAALLGSSDPQSLPPTDRWTEPPQQTAANAPAVRLEDIEVTGRPLDTLIRDFVNEVAAPNPDRGLARWQGEVCIGVANLRAETAQYLVDRVSTVAEDLGLRPGAPGCRPDVMIVASDDPDNLAETLVRERPRAFRAGGSGMDRGGAALRAFQASDQPVRWWQVAMPVDADTGQRATRLPGECRDPCETSMDYAPVINLRAASRLSTQIVNNLFRTVVILDVNQVDQVSAQQLADYVAMITFAQIDPEADTSRYASILNVFGDPESASTLTDWDRAYLIGLYDAQRTRASVRAGRSEIASSILREHQRLTANAPADTTEDQTDAPLDPPTTRP